MTTQTSPNSNPSHAHTSGSGVPEKVVVIGGVAGGMSAATRLRRLSETTQITVFERGGEVSFANCGLPYHVGEVIPHRSSLVLQTPGALKNRFNIDVHVRTEVTAIDRANKTVQVREVETGKEYSAPYDALVLSPGSSPIRPPLPGVEKSYVLWNLDDMDRMIERTQTAQSAIVVGGGFIGLEVAENLAHKGMKVTLVEALPQLMPLLDPEMAWLLVERARVNDVDVHLAAKVQEVTDQGVTLEGGKALDADMVVMAVGARPNLELAKEAGLEIGAAGGIAVDDQQRSSDPAIWAVGDAAEKKRDAGAGMIPLAGLANRHGRYAADSIMGRPVRNTTAYGTSIVGFFGLAAASTGVNERVLRDQGRAMRIIHSHPIDHAGYYPDAAQMAMKIIVDPETDLILGAQVVGDDGVDKRIDVLATAMQAGLTATDLIDLELAYAPQFGSAKDPINMAGYINDNRVGGEDSAQWHEVDQLAADGWELIDVRSSFEYTRGTIPGAEFVALDSIRDNLDSLRGRKLIVFDRVGQRAHTAASILRLEGIEVKNLDGGYLTWQLGTFATTATKQEASTS
ncbi:FAD-dependent oxidoreductase [Pontimonas salivibrio]|uniref:FAD-dependent oxidoreductase n=1 Tax=Pontimonas salivibrio TaxID=1159327 RepID=UPI000CF301F8|nr:FAD-dependent oxidoreductase [Pontimonas salivibrio]